MRHHFTIFYKLKRYVLIAFGGLNSDSIRSSGLPVSYANRKAFQQDYQSIESKEMKKE